MSVTGIDIGEFITSGNMDGVRPWIVMGLPVNPDDEVAMKLERLANWTRSWELALSNTGPGWGACSKVNSIISWIVDGVLGPYESVTKLLCCQVITVHFSLCFKYGDRIVVVELRSNVWRRRSRWHDKFGIKLIMRRLLFGFFQTIDVTRFSEKRASFNEKMWYKYKNYREYLRPWDPLPGLHWVRWSFASANLWVRILLFLLVFDRVVMTWKYGNCARGKSLTLEERVGRAPF